MEECEKMESEGASERFAWGDLPEQAPGGVGFEYLVSHGFSRRVDTRGGDGETMQSLWRRILGGCSWNRGGAEEKEGDNTPR